MSTRPVRERVAEIVEFLSRGDGAEALAAFIGRQRWFAAKARGVTRVEVEDWAALDDDVPTLLTLMRVDGERYFVPLAALGGSPARDEDVVAQRGATAIADAHADPAFGRALVAAIAAGRTIEARAGRFACRPMTGWAAPGPEAIRAAPAERLGGEQSNTSLALGDLILKSFRRPQAGVNPDVEVTAFLTGRTAFTHVPRLCGWIEYAAASGEPSDVAVLQQLVPNVGDGWRYTLEALREVARAVGDSARAVPLIDALTADMHELGRVTGGLHAALASDASLPAFRPEPMTAARAREWADRIVADVERLVSGRSAALSTAPELRAGLAELDRGTTRAAEVVQAVERLSASHTHVIRCHADYHLGQVLKTPDSFAVIDFEGEPARPASERRAKQPPLRDVAGMFRSFDYAIHSVRRERDEWRAARVVALLDRWHEGARGAFLDGYLGAVASSPAALVPASREDVVRACAAFELEKACYELEYELNNRPDWVPIPVAGIRRILGPRV